MKGWNRNIESFTPSRDKYKSDTGKYVMRKESKNGK
jgi:hypothetical protein